MDNTTRAERLSELLSLQRAPLAIRFTAERPAGVPAHSGDMPAPTEDGRTGRVAAGCVFWVHAEAGTFTTEPADHGNCSVGSLTHGLQTLEQVAGNADVAALLESGWVTQEMVPGIPTLSDKPAFITYGPLAEAPAQPDVVFMRLNAKQVMVLRDAVPELRTEGKPQCHIIPMAREQGEVAVSVGCMLSRVRTGMPNTEMTCAIPGRRLDEVLERLERTCAVDNTVARYAAEDAARFRSA